jgi:hypothetical protein
MSQGQGHASKGMRLAMLEARQKALESMADQIGEALDRVAKGAQGTEGRVSEQAAQHLEEASDAMDQVETQLDRMQQAPDQAALSQNNVPLDVLDRILDQLDLADTAMDDSLLDSPLDKQIKQAQKITDELMQDIEAMEKAPQTVDAEAMKKKLKNAERLLNNLVQAQSTVVKKGQRGEGLPNSFALTDFQTTPLSKAARQMVHRLWTAMAVANQTEGRALEMPGSASQFWESENAFFERASRFQGRTVDK